MIKASVNLKESIQILNAIVDNCDEFGFYEITYNGYSYTFYAEQDCDDNVTLYRRCKPLEQESYKDNPEIVGYIASKFYNQWKRGML